MPGGDRYRQWYAMRKKLQAEGKWKGQVPTHSVPATEEGEPAAKDPRLDSGDSSPDTPSVLEGAGSDSGSPGSSTDSSLPPLEEPWTVEGMASTGFTVLAWVKDDTPLLEGDLSETTKDRIRTELLRDFCTLIGMRWGMEVDIVTHHGTQYAYGANGRFTVSTTTLRNAMGTLEAHVDILRGSTYATSEQLANYRVCKKKWTVPEIVTESSSGWGDNAQGETSQQSKRRRY